MEQQLSGGLERQLRALAGALAALGIFAGVGVAAGIAAARAGLALLAAAEAGRLAPEHAGLGVGLLCALPGAIAVAAELAGRVHQRILGPGPEPEAGPFGWARGAPRGRKLLAPLLLAPALLPAVLVVRASVPEAALALGLGMGAGLTLAAELQARALRGQWSASLCFAGLLGLSTLPGLARIEFAQTIYPLAGGVYLAWSLAREVTLICRGLRASRAPGPDLTALAAEVRALVRLRHAVVAVWVGGGLLAWVGLLVVALVEWGSPLRAGLLAAGCGVLGSLLVAWPVERATARCARRAWARLDARFGRDHLDRGDARARVRRILAGKA